MLNKINNEMLTIISAKCINPKSKKRYPPTMTHKALMELKFSPVLNKPAKIQALEAIKLLCAKQTIPIVRTKMKVKVILSNNSDNGDLIEKLTKLITSENSTVTPCNSTTTAWELIGLIDPVSYRDLVTLVKDGGLLQVLNMAVIDQGSKA